ncbi:MAG: hypothetical protein H6670_11420 [Anaerolineaceae bacterium]|nr:hypothetical protein [Anaerolineaceae bacterium]
MKRSYLFILVTIVLLSVIAGAVLLIIAPPTTEITVRSCVTDADDQCLTLPRITGDNLDGETITLPDDITSEYALLVMPFSREEQTQAINWLPIYQEWADNRDDLSYYSLAVLVVDAPFRPLVIGGLNVAVADPAVRHAVIVAFVEETDQQAALTALNRPDRDALLALLVTQSGEVLWQHVGAYEAAAADELREVLAKIDN